MLRAIVVVAGLAWAPLASAAGGDPVVELAGQRYQVELARTEAQRMRGLMYRSRLAEDRGMLFIWREAAPRSIWMKNTRIPLDILFLDSARTVVAFTAAAEPCRVRDCPVYASGVPARYVLEINAGEIERLGVAVGDRVRFSAVPD